MVGEVGALIPYLCSCKKGFQSALTYIPVVERHKVLVLNSLLRKYSYGNKLEGGALGFPGHTEFSRAIIQAYLVLLHLLYCALKILQGFFCFVLF